MDREPQVSVRELKNQTTRILRRVEAGERITVTKRGRPVAVIESSTQILAPASDSIYRSLQLQIEARQPGLHKMSGAAAKRDFERISRKIARTIPYKSWQEMDRVAKGDRCGLLDSSLFIVDRVFKHDAVYPSTRAFLALLPDVSAAVPLMTLLELCGAASFRLSTDETERWLRRFCFGLPSGGS